MRNCRGVALLAALWLVVAIATVALALSLEAIQHRIVGLAASDGGAGRAAAEGGLEIALGRLERAFRQRAHLTGSAVDRLRASDPWLDASSLFPDTLRLGDMPVRIQADDMESRLNINFVGPQELRNFLDFFLRDATTAYALAQAILDWRDRDDLTRPRGAEREDYLARRRLELPANVSFRDLEELRFVEGMTPALLTRLRPYLRTRGTWLINVNSAPEPVLYAIPGMRADIVARILALRSQHERIASRDQLAAIASGAPDVLKIWQQSFMLPIGYSTTTLQVTVTAYPPSSARPVQLLTDVEWDESRGARIKLYFGSQMSEAVWF